MLRREQEATYIGLTILGLQHICEDAINSIAELMPHSGEKGILVETIVRDVLGRMLPKKFAIGTGMTINSVGDCSKQTDIVIYDHYNNYPILLSDSTGLFPVERVYGTVEVKAIVNPYGKNDPN